VRSSNPWLLPGTGFLFAMLLTTADVALPTGSVSASTGAAFNFEWTGAPAAPARWIPQPVNDWDVVVHDRDVAAGKAYPSTMAQHGSNCGAYPASHFVDDMDNAVYICNNHVMTALNSPGYGEIELTPAQLADWSGGTVRISWSVSTLRSSDRDWWDVNVTPFAENLVTPTDNGVDLEGAPRDHVNCAMSVAIPTKFSCYVRSAFARTDLPANPSQSMEEALGGSTSGVVRTRFELDVSPSHIRFGMPDQNNWFVDADASMPFSQGVVQLGHHTYDPDKTTNCPAIGNTACTGDTWHWSHFSISNAVPFTMLRLNPSNLPATGGSQALAYKLPQPAPRDAYLRFSASGDFLHYSVDAGKTWTRASEQPATHLNNSSWKSYFLPIPAGTTSVQFKGNNLSFGPWLVQDPAIWSLTEVPVSITSPTPVQGAVLVPSPAEKAHNVVSGSAHDSPLETAYHAIRDSSRKLILPLVLVALSLSLIIVFSRRRSRRY